MTTDESVYREITEICRKSEQILSERMQEIKTNPARSLSEIPPAVKAGLPLEELSLDDLVYIIATGESEPYFSMWKEFSKKFTGPIELINADLSGLLFKDARFDDYNFIDCNFKGRSIDT